jgi:hypothetical protein
MPDLFRHLIVRFTEWNPSTVLKVGRVWRCEFIRVMKLGDRVTGARRYLFT